MNGFEVLKFEDSADFMEIKNFFNKMGLDVFVKINSIPYIVITDGRNSYSLDLKESISMGNLHTIRYLYKNLHSYILEENIKSNSRYK